MLGRDISPNRQPNNPSPRLPIRPRSQDAAYRSRSPIAQAFFTVPNEPKKEQQEKEQEEAATEETQINESEHQLACPWNKVKKLRSRESTKSPTKEELHPRPWGVRSPKEIPCTCKIAKDQKLARQAILNITPSIGLKSPGHIEILKTLEMACKEIDRVKIQLTSEEATDFTNKIKTALEKKVKGKGKPPERGTKQLKKASSLSSHQPKLNSAAIVPQKDYLKDKQIQSPPTSRQILHNTSPGDNVMLAASPGAMTMRPTAVVGTMESTNYFIELSAGHPVKQNPNDFKNIMTQVLPSVDKPKLVSVDGSYFAEVPNDFGVPANQVCPDSRLLGKRTENVTFYAMADKHPQNVIFAKPKSPYSNSKYIPVAKLPALGLPQTVNKQIVKK